MKISTEIAKTIFSWERLRIFTIGSASLSAQHAGQAQERNRVHQEMA
jgi:hypothetical protein